MASIYPVVNAAAWYYREQVLAQQRYLSYLPIQTYQAKMFPSDRPSRVRCAYCTSVLTTTRCKSCGAPA